MTAENNLTLTDIEFLRAVEELNNNPEKYRDTDIGEMPANTSSIRKNTDLTQEQVKYRMGGNSNSRGFETETEEMPQVIISHSAKPTNKGFGPRSAELTSEGQEILKEAEETVENITNVTRVVEETKTVEDNKLRARIKRNNIVNYIEYDSDCSVALATDSNLLLIVTQLDVPEPYSGLYFNDSSNELVVAYYSTDSRNVQSSRSFDIDDDTAAIAEALLEIDGEDPANTDLI